ncbi:MAG: leucine-rich repeat protein [Spirochaetaceae bacterium]|jgi:outer membrane protein OmpA-like peptidoglycan-associated protein|nr:leucine-rich repeat protein [Spirochaetaceae bacterium]
MKNHVFLGFCALFAAAILPVYSQSTDEFEVLQKSDGTIAITGYTKKNASVTIPSNISGQTVNEVGSGAFSGNTTLRSVEIPASIALVGNSAFSGCTGLTTVSFGNGLEVIGDGAFANCRISTLELPASLRTIGNEAFAGNALYRVTIPDSVIRIGVSAFSKNPQLAEIILGSSLENVFFNAFGSGENPIRLIGVRKTGLDLASIGFDQSFVNVYGVNGAGIYIKQGNVWVKDSADPNTFVLQATPPPAASTFGGGAQTAAQAQTANFIGKVYIIYFPANGSTFRGLEASIAESNKKALDDIAAALSANRSLRARITGYANPIRPTAREERTVLQPLSLKRAQAVSALLEIYGLAPERFTVRGAGGTNPLASYSNPADWHYNRRVEITIIR